MKKIKYILFLGLLANLSVQAQVLDLQTAITTALSNNHSVIIANQQNDANQKDIHLGKAGLLPKVDLVGSKSLSQSLSNQEFATNAFPNVEDQEAGSSADAAQVQVSYVLFNGFGRIRSYSKLKESGEASVLQTKISLESTLLQVVNAYYEAVRLQELSVLNEQNLALSANRVKRVQTAHEFGNGSKIEVLNAKVDFNADSSNFISIQLDLQKAKNKLNFLLGRAITTPFEVNSTIEIPVLDSLNNYQLKAQANNTSILLSQVQLNIAQLDKKINQSGFMPTIATSFNYGYSGTQNDVGIIQKSSSLGYTGGISLSWNLFDGFKRTRALQKAKILIDVNETKKQQAILKVDMEMQNYYFALKTNLELIQLEQSNLELGTLNLQRSTVLFYNGSISNLQFRQAQLNLMRIQNKINNYKYLSKVYEFQLKRLTNELIQ